MADFIKLPRSLLDSPICSNALALGVCAYLYANADSDGQIKFSSGDAMRLFRITPRQFRTIINLLRGTNTATIKTTNKTTSITLCDFDGCNIKHKPKRQADRQTQGQTTTNKTSSKTLTLKPYVDPRFAEAWQKWLDYRKEINNRYKSAKSERIGYEQFIKKSNDDPIQAMEMVDNTIANGYKGLFPERSNGTAKPTTPAIAAKERRDRGLSLAAAIVSQSENLLNLYNGCGAISDHCENQE